MPTRISKTQHEYPYGHRRKVGEAFEVDQKDVDLLLALGRIEPEQAIVSHDGSAIEYQTRAMSADAPREKRGHARKAG